MHNEVTGTVTLFLIWPSYESVIYPNPCDTQKYDVLCPKLCYIRKCVNYISVSLCQNLDLGIASTDDKWHLAIPLARSCQY